MLQRSRSASYALFASNQMRNSRELIYGQVLTRRDISALFGGNARAFLPRLSTGEIVAGCFDPRVNPHAPFEVLVHSTSSGIVHHVGKRTAAEEDVIRKPAEHGQP